MSNAPKPAPDTKWPGPPVSSNPFDGVTGERPPWWTATQKPKKAAP